jgi:hypothetical protein
MGATRFRSKVEDLSGQQASNESLDQIEKAVAPASSQLQANSSN